MATQASTVKRIRRNAAQWRALLGKHKRSALSVTDFCDQEGLSEANFFRWRTRLGESKRDTPAAKAESSASGFVDLGLLGSTSKPKAGWELRLDLGEGLSLMLVRA